MEVNWKKKAEKASKVIYYERKIAFVPSIRHFCSYFLQIWGWFSVTIATEEKKRKQRIYEERTWKKSRKSERNYGKIGFGITFEACVYLYDDFVRFLWLIADVRSPCPRRLFLSHFQWKRKKKVFFWLRVNSCRYFHQY